MWKRKERVWNVECSKKALLIGLNYPGTNNELEGCINDVRRMKECLVNRYEFLEEDITVLIDTDPSYILPTADNIRLALSSLVDSAKPGDILFVHFSGHGDRVWSHNEDDDTGFDEFIVAADGNRITDDYFRELANRVPMGCRLTILSDSCHSGGLIEAAKEQIGKSTKERHQNSRASFEFNNFPPEGYIHVNYRSLSPPQFDKLGQKTKEDASTNVEFDLDRSKREGHFRRFITLINMKVRKLVGWIFGPSESSHPDSGILLSASQSDQLAAEGIFSGNSEVCGVFSHTILGIIEETRGRVTYRELVLKARTKLLNQGFLQEPGLYCSDCHADVPFLC